MRRFMVVALALLTLAIAGAIFIPDAHTCPGGGELLSQRSAETGEVDYGCSTGEGHPSDATLDPRFPLRSAVLLVGVLLAGLVISAGLKQGVSDSRGA